MIESHNYTQAARRVGKFFIGVEMIRRHPVAVQDVMAQCIILQAEYSFVSDSIVYIALSEWFDMVEPKQKIPEYDMFVTLHKNGDVNIRAEKI